MLSDSIQLMFFYVYMSIMMKHPQTVCDTQFNKMVIGYPTDDLASDVSWGIFKNLGIFLFDFLLIKLCF